MPHHKAVSKSRSPRESKATRRTASKKDVRYSVGLTPHVAHRVEKYAKETDSSMSKAIAALVQTGLEGQESRKQEFFKRLKANLANDDPDQQDQLIDDFRSLILGR